MIGKLTKIINSRLKPKDTEQDWVKERLEICRKCPFNTDNIVKKTFKDNMKIKANKFLNLILGKKVTDEATCSICGCMLIFKAAEESEYCPKHKWKEHEFKSS